MNVHPLSIRTCMCILRYWRFQLWFKVNLFCAFWPTHLISLFKDSMLSLYSIFLPGLSFLLSISLSPYLSPYLQCHCQSLIALFVFFCSLSSFSFSFSPHHLPPLSLSLSLSLSCFLSIHCQLGHCFNLQLNHLISSPSSVDNIRFNFRIMFPS